MHLTAPWLNTVQQNLSKPQHSDSSSSLPSAIIINFVMGLEYSFPFENCLTLFTKPSALNVKPTTLSNGQRHRAYSSLTTSTKSPTDRLHFSRTNFELSVTYYTYYVIMYIYIIHCLYSLQKQDYINQSTQGFIDTIGYILFKVFYSLPCRKLLCSRHQRRQNWSASA